MTDRARWADGTTGTKDPWCFKEWQEVSGVGSKGLLRNEVCILGRQITDGGFGFCSEWDGKIQKDYLKLSNHIAYPFQWLFLAVNLLLNWNLFISKKDNPRDIDPCQVYLCIHPEFSGFTHISVQLPRLKPHLGITSDCQCLYMWVPFLFLPISLKNAEQWGQLVNFRDMEIQVYFLLNLSLSLLPPFNLLKIDEEHWRASQNLGWVIVLASVNKNISTLGNRDPF